MGTHHIVLVPGLFGFAKLGGFDYFMHVEEALANRYLERGERCEFVLVSSPPTASIVYRTQVLMDSIQRACSDDAGAIHLVGHSTGGLDIRLLSSPSTWPDLPDWFDRVRTVTSVATPHYGTPLAYFLKRKLTKARATLLHARPERGAVKSAAIDAGLTELGRFSVQYRRLFGECPSATLNKSVVL